MMNIKRLLVLALFLTIGARVCHAQAMSQPGWFLGSPQGKTGTHPHRGTAHAHTMAKALSPGPCQTNAASTPSIAETITPEIQALARGLENDPLRIFNY